MIRSCYYFLSLLFVFALPVPAQATTPSLDSPASTSAATLNADVLLKQIENYFDQMDTVQARFIQTAPDGTQRVGTFYMDRPGKLRFDYDAPVTDLVVADGLQLYYYDGELKQTSSAPVGQTLADFLLRKHIRLSGDVRVTGVKEGGGLTQVTMVQTADEGAGTLTLGFTPSPFALKKWRVVDGTGAITEVELFNLQQNIPLVGKLFVYKDPANPQGKYN